MDHVEEVKCGHVRIYKDVLDLGDPLVHLALAFAHDTAFLVCPMCSDTFLRDFVHSAAAYLNLHPDTCVAHQCTMESLVAVVLRVVHPIAYTVFLIWIKAGDDREYVEGLCTF